MAGEKDVEDDAISLGERIHHFTWAWFTLTMSTGGIALLLSATPHRFRGLQTIGAVVYIFDLVLFCLLTIMICIRFAMYPGTFTKTVNHPTENLFIATFFLSISTLISGAYIYGAPHTGPWLLVVVRILFWMYSAITFLSAVIQYLILFTGKPLTMQSMTPAWILPIFPLMLTGTIAASMAAAQPVHHAIPIILAGTTFQTLGFMLAICMYSNYFGRLMTNGLPTPSTRFGMFISVGPPSFTGLAYIGMAEAAAKVFPEHFVVGATDVSTASVLQIMATFIAIALWTTSLFFFVLSLFAVALRLKFAKFHLTWWSLVFPNTGFIIAMIKIGQAINSPVILWVSTAATIAQIIIYLVVLVAHIRAVLKKQIMWPGKDEDRDD